MEYSAIYHDMDKRFFYAIDKDLFEMCIRDRDNGVIRKLAAYVILGINTEGKKEVLSITVGDNESSKYWLSVLNELKKRLDWLWIVLLKNGPQNTRIL